jgi:fatty acid amide hydrolase 2
VTDERHIREFAGVPATELAARVRRGAVHASEVLDAFAEQLERHNPNLNALVAGRLDDARREAAAIDDAVAAGEDPGPLAGIPFTTKEMVSVEGLPVTAGSLARKDAVASRDATFVRRLRDAGAIPIGVTNQSELGLWFESSNPIYGRTNNPYDSRRTAGGSSGGEGALVGAGLNAFGIGSDMGGSIRLPAFFCGVFGHKPTGNFVPTSGHFPVDYSDHRLPTPPSTRYISIGPMSRHASDLLPILRTISGACPDDDYAIDPTIDEPSEMAGKRVFYLEDPGMRMASGTTEPQADAVRRAVRALRNRGADVRRWDGPRLEHAMMVYTCMLTEMDDGIGLEGLLSGNGSNGVSLIRELPRLLRGKARHTIPAMMVVLGERFTKPSPEDVKKMSTYGRKLRDEIDEHLGDDGVLVLPTFPRPAPRHGTTVLRPFDLAYTALFNVTESPVTAVPMGLDRGTGVPTGVQIVGRRGMDHLTISAAIALEKEGHRWEPPRRRR